MSNLIQYAEILQRNLDLQITQQATTGWMEENAGQVQYLGAKTVKIPSMFMSGLGDYDRENGTYPKGAIELSYESYQLAMDRAVEFYFDRHDVDETNYVMQASGVMSNFQKNYVIPEIDAYRYSTIAGIAMDEGIAKTAVISAENALAAFMADVRELQNTYGVPASDLVACMPYSVLGMIEMSKENTGIVTQKNFVQGNVSFEVKSINGVAIIPVVGSRMKTAYVFHDGTTQFGFEPAANARNINWMILPRSAPIAISKTDAVKIFSPDENQNGDGWKTQYRKYHDVWLPTYAREAMVVSIAGV